MKNEDRKELFRAVFNTEHGRSVLREILSHCNVGRSVFDAENERRSCFNQGRQEVGQWLSEQTKENS